MKQEATEVPATRHRLNPRPSGSGARQFIVITDATAVSSLPALGGDLGGGWIQEAAASVAMPSSLVLLQGGYPDPASHAAPPERAGVGAINTARQVGSAVGVALLGTLGAGGRLAAPMAGAGAAFLTGALIVAIVVRRRARRRGKAHLSEPDNHDRFVPREGIRPH
jgi:hypothetical protein